MPNRARAGSQPESVFQRALEDCEAALVKAAGLIGEQARIQVAPTAPLPPLLLAALTGTWAAIFSAHALAFRAGSPLLALLPPVALVAFADTVLEDVVRPVYGVAFLVAATAVVFADSLRRVQGWGPVWASPGRAARLTSTAGKGARRVAAATVAVALVSPLLIPGFGSKAILDFSSRNEDQVRIDPLVSVQSQLDRDEPIEVFEVKTQEPVYWRMVALPTFDGTSWKPEEEPVAIDVGPGTPLVTNARPDPALVGESQTVAGPASGFRSRPGGTMERLAPRTGDNESEAYAVNAGGTAVGRGC